MTRTLPVGSVPLVSNVNRVVSNRETEIRNSPSRPDSFRRTTRPFARTTLTVTPFGGRTTSVTFGVRRGRVNCGFSPDNGGVRVTALRFSTRTIRRIVVPSEGDPRSATTVSPSLTRTSRFPRTGINVVSRLAFRPSSFVSSITFARTVSGLSAETSRSLVATATLRLVGFRSAPRNLCPRFRCSTPSPSSG